MQIRSKREFYKLWEAGCLGNRTQIFHSIDAALRAVPSGDGIGFRQIGQPNGAAGAWEKASSVTTALEIDARWRAAGRRYIMDDGFPNHRTTMQGEICRTVEGLYGFIAVAEFCGRVGLPPMRISMANGMHGHFYRAQVRALMQIYMDPASQDDVDALLELYPNATIEFASADVCVGNIPGRNTIIWEVRNY